MLSFRVSCTDSFGCLWQDATSVVLNHRSVLNAYHHISRLFNYSSFYVNLTAPSRKFNPPRLAYDFCWLGVSERSQMTFGWLRIHNKGMCLGGIDKEKHLNTIFPELEGIYGVLWLVACKRWSCLAPPNRPKFDSPVSSKSSNFWRSATFLIIQKS